MKLILKEGDHYIIRFDPGEEVISGLEELCRKEDIRAGFFSALGSSGEAVISYFNLRTKEYEDHDVKKRLEITSLIGNIAMMGDEPVVHAHGNFTNENLESIGGHVKSLAVSATCEVALTKLKGPVARAHDAESGLNLLN